MKTIKSDPMGEMLKFEFAGTDYYLIFEDNGRVAFAYLYKGKDIIGDVWLYNNCAAPIEPEWKGKTNPPFANPKEFIREKTVRSVSSQTDLTVVWEKDDDGNLSAVIIYLRNELFAGISPGAKPGWSVLTIKDGPLSKVMPK